MNMNMNSDSISESESDKYQHELMHCLGSPNMRSRAPAARRSVQVDLAWPMIPPGAFRAQQVTIEGAEMGDEVCLTEPYMRPPGLTYVAYMSQSGTVRISARNGSDRDIAGFAASYGITVNGSN